MRLRIQHPLIQIHNVLLTEQQIEVLHRLRQPKTLHIIGEHRILLRHIVDRRIPVFGGGMFVYGFEHLPADFAPMGRAGYAVEVPNGFYCFRAGCVLVGTF